MKCCCVDMTTVSAMQCHVCLKDGRTGDEHRKYSGKPGFQIYAYLVSYVLSTSTNMQLSSYKWAVMPTVPATPNVIKIIRTIIIIN